MRRRPDRSIGALSVLFLLAAILVVPGLPAVRAAASPPTRSPGPPTVLERVVDAAGRPAPILPALSGASARMLVSTSDPNAVPNDGIATNLTAFPSVSYPKNSSFQTGAEEVIGGFDAVFGIFTNDVMAPVAFFEVFNNSTDASVRLEYWTGLPIVAGEPYDFQLTSVGAWTWSLSVNEVPFGDNTSTAQYPFGASLATWAGGVAYSEVAIYSETTTVPSSYLATTALAIHRPGSGWYLPVQGAAHYIGPPSDSWGAQGRAQIPELPPGAVQSGTSYAAVDSSSTLWTGGPVPVDVSLALDEPSVTGLGADGVSVSVTTVDGAALGGVPVYIGDSLGGNASPATVLTASSGSSSTLFLAPNVTAAATDTLQATVTVLGYTGGASAGVSVTPAAEVVVSAEPYTLAMTPNENTTLTFHTSSPSGAPAGEVYMTFEALIFDAAPGSALTLVTYPSAGITNGSGVLTVSVLAPPGAGTFAVYAQVASLGAWGHANVSVSVRSLAPSFWQQYGPAVTDGGLGLGAVFVLAAIGLWLRQRGRARPALPEMDLRKLRLQAPDDSPPVSRTPPASGTP
jgi:hypothetical protein